jgi:hypothetical protein
MLECWNVEKIRRTLSGLNFQTPVMTHCCKLFSNFMISNRFLPEGHGGLFGRTLSLRPDKNLILCELRVLSEAGG